MAAQSRLAEETAEQPAVAARFLQTWLPQLDALRSAVDVDGSDGFLLAARGSSDNAARYAQYLWGLRLGRPVGLATPSLFTVYGHDVDLRRHTVVAISQSGSSPDVVSVVERAKAQGRPTVAVTNDPASPLARVADVVLDLGAGTEESVAATKTYTASLLAVAVLALAWGDPAGRAAGETELVQVPDALEAAVHHTSGLSRAVAVFADADRAVAVGRGLNLSTAYETALKMTELAGVLVAPYSPADLRHGPVGAVDGSVPAVLIAPDEPASASVLDLGPELGRRGVPVVVVAQSDRPRSGDKRSLPAGSVEVELPAAAWLPGWLTPLTAVVPGQLLARALAEHRGVDVDHPGGLAKVTRTR